MAADLLLHKVRDSTLADARGYRVVVAFSISNRDSPSQFGKWHARVAMTQRKQIAIAYSFAIPILFAFLIFEVGALYRLNAHEGEIVQGAAAVSDCDSFLIALHDAGTAAQGYVSSGSDIYRSSYADASSRLSALLAKLDELSKSDPAAQSKLDSLRNLTITQLGVLQREMDSRKTPRSAGVSSAPKAQGANVTAAIEQVIAGMRGDVQARLQQEQASAARSASNLDALVKYGGVVTIWIVGVAALLLFYDDSGRFRERIEQRLHTDVLESLPLAVCLAAESGAILYANPAAEDTFGYKPGELVARNIALLHDPSGHGAETSLVETLARLTPHEVWSGELPIRTKDGDSIRAVSWIGSIRVGERNCRVLIHGAPATSAQREALLAGRLRPALEEAEGIAIPPRATAPDGPQRTTPPGSEAVGVWRRAK